MGRGRSGLLPLIKGLMARSNRASRHLSFAFFVSFSFSFFFYYWSGYRVRISVWRNKTKIWNDLPALILWSLEFINGKLYLKFGSNDIESNRVFITDEWMKRDKLVNAIHENNRCSFRELYETRTVAKVPASEFCRRWYNCLTACFKGPLCSLLKIKKGRAVFILY